MKRENKGNYRPDVLAKAEYCWQTLAQFRSDRERCKRFTYGDQWGDIINVNKTSMTEEEYIRSQGNIPLKNNLIRRLVRNVLGVFRNQWKMPQCLPRDAAESYQASVMERLLEYNMRRNRLEELYARTLEEFLISGMAVHRKWFGTKGNHSDCWTDFVSPEKFFFDTASRDFRNQDLSIIGEIYEMTISELCASFASDEKGSEAIRALYMSAHPSAKNSTPLTDPDLDSQRCRVIEVWLREYRPVYLCHDTLSGKYYKIPAEKFHQEVTQENQRRLLMARRNSEKHGADSPSIIESRWKMEEEWHFYFLTPEGYVISEGVSPYLHGSHPYSLKVYPFVDGEIHSFVADIIDQQKFTNRLISMYDWTLRASAKGVLLFPEGSLPEGVSMTDVAEEWSKFNGLIVYKSKPGIPQPQQVSSGSANHGIADLLNIQLKMMEDVSGITSALQGKLSNNSISGTLYDQQTRNSLTALSDLLKCYTDFILEATNMDASNIRQFYSPGMISAIVGEKDPFISSPDFFNSAFDFSIVERGNE